MIRSFRGEYRFLSNFYPAEVTYDGIAYPTVEHAYQAAKSINRKYRIMIAMLPTPGAAKRAGMDAQLRPGWDDIKRRIMLDLVRQKFNRHRDLREKLEATGYQTLIEGNTWGDTYWGECRGVGENMLGKILMHVRFELFLG